MESLEWSRRRDCQHLSTVALYTESMQSVFGDADAGCSTSAQSSGAVRGEEGCVRDRQGFMSAWVSLSFADICKRFWEEITDASRCSRRTWTLNDVNRS